MNRITQRPRWNTSHVLILLFIGSCISLGISPAQDICAPSWVAGPTHPLSQQCSREGWLGGGAFGVSNGEDEVMISAGDRGVAPSEGSGPSDPTSPTSDDSAAHQEGFLSFEDWKARQAGLDDSVSSSDQDRVAAEPQAERIPQNDRTSEVAEAPDNSSDAAPSFESSELAPEQNDQRGSVMYDDGRTQYYRSKDAGKTCKERFSYSSFDAGAAVLKTNTGAKNAKAILLENKDSYMLLECAAENKFVIVELTDDILVDTIVLANFEFFSSMVKQFRVCVSDRYPVKPDKWKELGVFEAKNSRDIQPFLVQNPLIWAKYVRIEFLSHYGNEYYCPVSLLRVHGTRMLESWKESEVAGDEDDQDDRAEPAEPSDDNARSLPRVGDEGEAGTAAGGGPGGAALTTELVDQTMCPAPVVYPTYPRCEASEQETTLASTRADPDHRAAVVENSDPQARVVSISHDKEEALPNKTVDEHVEDVAGPQATSSPAPPTVTPDDHQPMVGSSANAKQSESSKPSSPKRPPSSSSTGSATKPSAKATPGSSQASHRSRNGTATAPSAPSPTVQESFHKAVSKRIQLLESNVSLSLRYLEEHSRFLRESQLAAERRQLTRIDSFMDHMNNTVVSELSNIRQQSDQLWQSTIASLESQRDQSQREALALGSRLNVLAEEVVFQKRLAILQAVLLLSCLALVIFSRAPASPQTSSQSPTRLTPNTRFHPSFPNFSPGYLDALDRYYESLQVYVDEDWAEEDP